MLSLVTLLRVGGVLQLSLLLASALMPFVLNWWSELRKLGRFTQQVIWVHGLFIVLVIFGLGAASILLAESLTAGTPLARALCGFIALFWLARLGIQLFFYDAEPHLTHWLFKLGYHSLTGIFTYLAIVFGAAA